MSEMNFKTAEIQRVAARKWKAENPQKIKETLKEWKDKNPDYNKDYLEVPKNKDKQLDNYFKRKYGTTLEEFNAKHTNQEGVCAICHLPETLMRKGKTQRLSQDHNHLTGQVRDLLCNNCNTIIGASKESEQLLLHTIEYLRKHNGRFV